MRILFISVISVAIITLLIWSRPDTFAELQPLPPPTVKIGKIEQVDIQPVSEVTGKLRPVRKASLHFQVSGQVETRLVEAGQYVEENVRLLSIESGDYVDAVNESKALLKTEQNAVARDSRLLTLMRQERELQEQEVERLKKLGQSSLSSKSKYDQALQALYRQQSEEARLKHSVDSSRSRIMIEQTRLNKAERNLERTQLLSPFSGTVNRVYVEVGDYVSPGQVALEMVQVDQLDLNLEITGQAASQLKLNQKIKVSTDLGDREGQIIALSVDPDSETNTHALKIRLPSDGLFSGQLAVAHLPGYLYKDASVTPITSILYDNGKPYVFEVVDENHVLRKPVKIIERYNDVQIISGVEPGTLIVSRDVSSLVDGQAIVVN